jgi:capsular polysaccharide biosynthesis protein
MIKLLIAVVTVVCLAGSASLSFAAMTDTAIQQKLQGQGYTNIQIRQHDKDHVDVTATKNGKVEKLAVDPQSGAVKPDTDNDD